MVVSSAYDNKLRDVQCLMSCMYRRNIIGPIILPWGTPHVISSKADLLLFIIVYCFLCVVIPRIEVHHN